MEKNNFQKISLGIRRFLKIRINNVALFAFLLLLPSLHGKSQTKPIAKLRVLTHNVYSLSKENCADRLKSIGRKIAGAKPRYDIIGFQEFYNSPFDIGTCNPDHLNNAIWSSGLYKNSDNYYRYYPEVGISLLSADPGIDGGIGIFTLHKIIMFDDWEWNNDNQGREAKEGFIFARISMPNIELKIDAYIVHLNSGGGEQDRRKEQLKQLAKEIKNHSSKSGNPVLVMGDFNIGGPPSNNGNKGYSDIMEILKQPEDLWMTVHPEEPGFSYDCLSNSVTSNCDYQERIDYIFIITDQEFTNSPYQIRIASNNNVKIVQWKLPRKIDHREDSEARVRDHRSKFVSDHFGVEATIDIYKPTVRDHRTSSELRDHRIRNRVRDHRGVTP